MEFIKIRGARTHCLKNINLDLPRNRLTVITGPSGSGKSSLAFDTLYAECRAVAVEMDTGEEYLFSSKFACPVCNYALQELEPRLFSFNNPMGACQKCHGLGQIPFFDPARGVAYPHLSLAAGAIKGWDRRNQYMSSATD